jgi:hypothetical protein
MLKRLTAAALLLSTAACTSLQTVVQPAEFIPQNNPRFVVVTTADLEDGDDPYVLDQPRIQNGSLVGLYQGESLALPMTQVRVVRAKQFDRRRTTFAIIGSAVVLGGVGILIANTGNTIDNRCQPPDCGNFPHVR